MSAEPDPGAWMREERSVIYRCLPGDEPENEPEFCGSPGCSLDVFNAWIIEMVLANSDPLNPYMFVRCVWTFDEEPINLTCLVIAVRFDYTVRCFEFKDDEMQAYHGRAEQYLQAYQRSR